jgi:hypothetical protein
MQDLDGIMGLVGALEWHFLSEIKLGILYFRASYESKVMETI